MYTNGNIGNIFDQYKISYILPCIIIIIMQEVYMYYLPSVYFYLNYFSQKGPSVLCGVLLWAWWSLPPLLARAGLVLSVVHSSATKMKLQTTTPSATPLHFCWMYTCPRRSGGQTTNNCSHWRLPKQREHANIRWSRLVCSDCVWQVLVCC